MRDRLPSCDLVQSYGMSEFPVVMAYLEPTYAVSKLRIDRPIQQRSRDTRGRRERQ